MSSPPATLAAAPAPAPSVGSESTFRGDIEGLRAIAVLLVVLSHAGVAGLAGGFVGVDVFFVISGFLITSLLIRELGRTGRISISGFYARRAVRLLPASSVVMVLTLVGSWLWLSPLRSAEYAWDGIASAFYFVNIRMAQTGTDYFAAEASPSPFQHFWSLAVEEQFYLVWPLLILLATLVGRRRGRVRMAPVVVALALLSVISFVLSVTETQRSAPWAYFGAHTRAWELGSGAMVALAVGRLRQAPAWFAAPLTWVGIAAVIMAAVRFDETTPFPGSAAALPVVGAALVIAGGCAAPRLGAGLLLGRAPLRWVGKLSYGWYLWHWPVLIIAPSALGVEPSVPLNLALCACALVLAAVSLRLVEDPVRHRRSLRVRPGRGIGLGLSLSVAVAVGAAVVLVVPPTVPTGADRADLGAALAGARDPQRVLDRFIAEAARTTELPANLSPSLAESTDARPVIYADGCHVDAPVTRPKLPCAYGDPAAATTVVLLGDSHAAHWFPALDQVARERHWKLVSLTKSGCSLVDLPIRIDGLAREYTECAQWRRNALRAIRDLKPDLVVAASHVNFLAPAGQTDEQWTARWRAGWGRTFAALRRAAQRVVTMVDTPRLDEDAPECVAQHPQQIDACATPTAEALRRPALRAAIGEQAERNGVGVIDPTPWLCAARCPVVLGNVLVYHDSGHLTTRYAELLAPLLGRRLPALTAE
ncbi:acyltransferase family protein [Micromonospora mirobrigensis]|uniref:acyltransferase family protein n=1 Tax=Micromonospora mirobrigensis TaxID=262898 RepID=UPI000B8947E1|nr:acyltransferase family protein [Micromonospora mirobrigensis]